MFEVQEKYAFLEIFGNFVVLGLIKVKQVENDTK